MTDPAVISAVAAAVGVVVGSVASSLGIVLRERVVGRRERETQEALRQQQLADQRAAFQRDTVLALQDAIGELWALLRTGTTAQRRSVLKLAHGQHRRRLTCLTSIQLRHVLPPYALGFLMMSCAIS